MSQQSEANAQILGLFRFGLTISLMLLLMWGIASQYQSQRRQAQSAAMSALASRIAEQAAQLHGLWLSQNRPPSLYAQLSAAGLDEGGGLQMQAAPGVSYVMNRQGWPIGVVGQAEADGCGQLWRTLLTMAPEIDGDEVQVTPLRLAPGCEFRLGVDGFNYRFTDGMVTVVGGE